MVPTTIEQGDDVRGTKPALDKDATSTGDDRDYDLTIIKALFQFYQQRRFLVKSTGIGFLARILIAFLLPVRYTAVAKLMPPQQAQSSTSILMNQIGSDGGSLAALSAGGLGALRSPSAIYVGLLNSRPVADAIIQKFRLSTVYKTKDMTATRAKLAKATEISSGKEGFISVSVTDREKKRAAEMANAYTAELRALTQSLAVTEASQRRLFFEQQLKKAKEAVIEAEISFQQVQQKNGVVQLDAQTRTIIENLAALRGQIAAKEIELDALRSYSTDRNPSVQLAERELLTLKEEAGRLEQKSHSSGAVNMGLKDVSSVSFDYLRAEHELKYRQTMFDLLVKQYDAAALDESKQAAIVQVLEPAIEPDRKSSPNRPLIILLSVLAGLFLGIAWTIVKWWKVTLPSMTDSRGSIFRGL